MNYQTIFLICLFLILIQLLQFFGQKKQQNLRRAKQSASKTPKHQIMRPKTEKDCPQCRASLAADPAPVPCSHTPIPWSQVKSKRGRKKKISTQHYFCSNETCTYYQITDEAIHALVGDGEHGTYEDIQDFLCQACKKKFTCRKHTVLYQLKTPSKFVSLSLKMTSLGMDPSAVEETLEIRESTIRTWLARSGAHSRKLHDRFFVALDLTHLQLDELWADVKQAGQDVWVWTVCDAKTKLIPVVQLGPRTLEMAYRVVHELKSRLKEACHPVFSSDGLKHYFSALTAHFGEWVQGEGESKPSWMVLADFAYAQVVKTQRRFRLVSVETRLVWGLPTDYFSRLKNAGLSGRINTSYVERANLTLRQCVSKLTRRTWSKGQFSTELGEHIFWWLAYYHFVRNHEGLRVRLSQPIKRKGRQQPIRYRKMTPAMAAGLTRHRWSVLELISYPLL